MCSKCTLQLRSEENYNQRTFADGARVIQWSLINNGRRLGTSLGNEILSSLHLEWLRIISFSVHHWSISLITDYKLPWRHLTIVSERLMSSTYFHLSSWFIAKLLTMMRKSSGPRIVPWGTPPFTRDQSEKAEPNFTLCLLWIKKLITQFIN